MYHGILNIYKEKDYTSHDVVAILRKILWQKKIGHTGTLDPQAVGVLPICLGKATKVAGLLTDKTKVYRTCFKLGAETDTQDHTGKVINEMTYNLTEAEIKGVILSFVGKQQQIPPMYSAIKINGQKLYDLARAGKTVERKPRSMTIYSILDIVVELPYIKMTVECSKGTYIRTLCRDISESLGTCGHMVELERTASGQFKKETALTLDQIKKLIEEEKLDDYVLKIDELFNMYKKVVISRKYYKLLDNGNKLSKEASKNSTEMIDTHSYNVYNEEDDYMGIYEWSDKKKSLMPINFFCIRG